jgi:GT2 family glycosyltransferase
LGPAGLPPFDAQHDSSVAQATDCEWLSGTLLLVRRDCVLEIGPFDERFGSYVEDLEYCQRARDSGWRVGRVGSARATQLGSRSPRASAWIAANRLLLRALRATGPARLRARLLLAALVAKSEFRLLTERLRTNRSAEAIYYRDAWARALLASFRRERSKNWLCGDEGLLRDEHAVPDTHRLEPRDGHFGALWRRDF